ALMLWFDEPLSHPRRVEFEAEFHPAGNEGPPRRLRGSQATRGGIKHHGNTSFWEGLKKPLSLRCDEPHRLLDTNAATRHLYLLNGFLDATKMRNKLAFDLFRSFGGPGRPRQAPELDWTEVFVNGRYFGIYEMSTRIDGETLGEKDDGESETPSGAVLYKIASLQNLFMGSGRRAFEQILPPAAQFPCEEPLREFADFVRRADRETFAREIGDRLDLDNAVDFLLLLYFSGNKDGYDGNFYLARDSAPHARFQFAVWDYDHGFGKRNLAMSNLIIDRFRRDVPGFDERLRAR
ncbi:MAG TPA: CotH kinase family protein, partial [Kiritimatiellia bacterium]|nr:CotH kinase family protein [Kiritimatiellia bacterium]